MANIKVVGLKTTKLWLFYVLCVFCIFGIEKNEISKNVFSKGYFKIVLCTFMTNFMIVAQRMTCVVYMLDLKIGKIAGQDQDKNYGPVGLTTGGSNRNLVYNINFKKIYYIQFNYCQISLLTKPSV